MGRVWAYLGENLDSISDKDKEMLVNLRKSGKFTRKEIISFNKSLVAQQYDEELLNCAVDMVWQALTNSFAVLVRYFLLCHTMKFSRMVRGDAG